MSKELEPIEALDKLLDGYSRGMAGRSYYDIVREALERLEAIDNVEPSEALEAFGRITLHTEYDNDSHYDGLQFEDDCKLVDKALERLEAIENVNPSEALKCLESYINNIIFAKDLISQKKQLLANIATIKYSLQRLESVDNSKPSAALKALKVLDETISPLLEPVLAEYEDDLSDKITSNYFALKQALLNAREQEKENELLKEIIKSFFDRGCPLHQYTDKEGILQIEVDNECSTMHLGKFKGIDLDKKLKEVLE